MIGPLRIDPGMAPGGLVIRIRRGDGTVVLFEPVTAADRKRSSEIGARHDRIAWENSTPGSPAMIEAFDGDSGRCIRTFVVIAFDDTDTTGPER